MHKKIKIYYILTNVNGPQIMTIKAYTDTNIIAEINHTNNEYYIGFSGFDENGQIVGTAVKYDFYYFYNMVEDIMVITDSINFKSEMSPEKLLIIETNRIKKLKEQKVIATIELYSQLKSYEIYKAEMKDWIIENGSKQLKAQFAFSEDVELSYLIERINVENMKISSKTRCLQIV
jgi:hypothetical protein